MNIDLFFKLFNELFCTIEGLLSRMRWEVMNYEYTGVCMEAVASCTDVGLLGRKFQCEADKSVNHLRKANILSGV